MQRKKGQINVTEKLSSGGCRDETEVGSQEGLFLFERRSALAFGDRFKLSAGCHGLVTKIKSQPP